MDPEFDESAAEWSVQSALLDVSRRVADVGRFLRLKPLEVKRLGKILEQVANRECTLQRMSDAPPAVASAQSKESCDVGLLRSRFAEILRAAQLDPALADGMVSWSMQSQCIVLSELAEQASDLGRVKSSKLLEEKRPRKTLELAASSEFARQGSSESSLSTVGDGRGRRQPASTADAAPNAHQEPPVCLASDQSQLERRVQELLSELSVERKAHKDQLGRSTFSVPHSHSQR